MKLRDLFRFRRKAEERSNVPVETWLSSYSIASPAGVPVNAATAMRVSAVYACVRVIAETIASLPLHVYRSGTNGKTPARDVRLWRMLHDAPNRFSTSFTFRESLVASLLLHGNGYALIAGAAEERSLIYLAPSAVSCERDPRTLDLRYLVRLSDGRVLVVSPDDMLHVPGLSFDGVSGLSPIAAFMSNVVGTAIAADEQGARMMANGSKPSGVLEHPGKLGGDAVARLASQVERATSGANVGKTLVLEEGMKFNPITIAARDAQFIEQRKFSVSEIARIFRVPPHMIGDLERATFSNIEHQSIDFVTHTIRPWLVRIEQELQRKLIADGDDLSIEFKIDGLLRGDLKTRYEAYSIARQYGWLSANDIRDLENLNRIENGDQYLVPVNMTTPAKLEASDDAGGASEDDGASQNDQGNRAARLRAV